MLSRKVISYAKVSSIAIFVLNLIGYSYENKYINGFLIIILSFLLTHLIDNDKFFIETGIKLHELGDDNSKNRQVFNLFNKENRLLALYNLLISVSFFITIIIVILVVVVI